MTLDDLEKEFWGGEREQPARVRLARVVKALRDEIASQFGFNDRWNVGAMSGAFNEILGDAGEKVAGVARADDLGIEVTGVDRRETVKQIHEQPEADIYDPSAPATAPATAPAPAVCVWTYKPDEVAMPPTSCVEAISVSLGGKWVCTGCLQPIKFTEAKT